MCSGRFSRIISASRAFANQAVIAIQNVRLFQRDQGALERQTATSEILQVIGSSPTDTQPVFDAIVNRGAAVPGAMISVARPDGGMGGRRRSRTRTHNGRGMERGFATRSPAIACTLRRFRRQDHRFSGCGSREGWALGPGVRNVLGAAIARSRSCRCCAARAPSAQSAWCVPFPGLDDKR